MNAFSLKNSWRRKRCMMHAYAWRVGEVWCWILWEWVMDDEMMRWGSCCLQLNATPYKFSNNVLVTMRAFILLALLTVASAFAPMRSLASKFPHDHSYDIDLTCYSWAFLRDCTHIWLRIHKPIYTMTIRSVVDEDGSRSTRTILLGRSRPSIICSWRWCESSLITLRCWISRCPRWDKFFIRGATFVAKLTLI